MINPARINVLVDIDHTLSNAFSRDVMLDGAHGVKGHWDDYHAASVYDEPLHDIVLMVNALRVGGLHVIGLTARPGKWRTLTMNWMLKHGINIDELLMRPDDDYRRSPELKLELARQRFTSVPDEVAFIMDDREDVCAAFAAIGVTALRVFGRQQ